MMNAVRKRTVSVLLFVMHKIFCPYGLLVLSAFLTFTAMPLVHILGGPGTTRTAHWILTETPYFPVQISIGLIGGLLIGTCRKIPFTTWMWVFPLLVLLAALMFRPLQPGQPRLDHFFGWGGLPPQRQYEEVAVTMPFYLAVAYSAAAYFGSRKQPRGVETAAITQA
jgi:hypothetical protein